MSARRLVTALMIAAGLLLGLYVYRVLLAPHPPLSADEAGHALPAARMAIALREGSLHGFLQATRREVVWPFLHPWVVTPFFLAFGMSARVARLASLFTFGVSLTLLAALARELARGSDHEDGAHRESSSPALLGWLSAALLITATTWELVCTVMSESLGMALTLAVLLAEARAARRQRISGHLVGGVLVAAAFFTKYSYGLPLMAAVLLSLAWRGRRGAWAPLIAALAGMAVPIAVWLAWILFPDPRRANELFAAFVNRDEGLRGLADLSFYPAAAASALGTPAAVVTLLLLAAALAHAPRASRLPALLFVGVSLLMLTLHPNKQVRYLFATLPVVLILAETELADRMQRLRGREALWAVLVLAVLVTRNPLVAIRQAAVSAAPFEQARPILDYVEEHVADRQPVLFLGTTGLLPHLALTWQLLEREQREPAVELLLFPRAGDAEGAYRTGYPPQPGPEYGTALEKALASGRFRSVVTLELGPGSPFLPDWLAKWDAFGQNYVRAMRERENTADYALESERAFPASDTKVRIFVRRDGGSTGSDLARSGDRSD